MVQAGFLDGVAFARVAQLGAVAGDEDVVTGLPGVGSTCRSFLPFQEISETWV
jgi:hypothetical protein